jgi:hypothetical protein
MLRCVATGEGCHRESMKLDGNQFRTLIVNCEQTGPVGWFRGHARGIITQDHYILDPESGNPVLHDQEL